MRSSWRWIHCILPPFLPTEIMHTTDQHSCAPSVLSTTCASFSVPQVFRQTSIFTVSSAAENNESLLQHGSPADGAALDESGAEGLGLSEDDEAWDCGTGFWSDEEEDARMDSKGRRARDRCV